MKNISFYLSKFKDIDDPLLIKKIIILSIKKTINKDIELDEIEIKNGIITINSNSYIKAEIFLKKEKILENIKSEIPDIFISSVRF